MLYEGLKVLKTMMVTAALSATLVVGADAAELKGGIVDTGTLNFRSAPSESAPIIDKLYNGYRVCILDVDENGWASISISGNPGYVSAEYLDVLDVMDVNGGGAKVTASALNVRSYPSTDSAVLTTLPQGTVATITGINKGWFQVTYNGVQGYVSPDYIEIVPLQQQAASEPGASSVTSDVISYAKQFIGTPYVYGGSTPSGFDCSGFTSYVYKHFGISLPHSSSAQYSSLAKVSRDQLKAGDLVFFTNGGSGIGHVGIYVGNNQFIHSPSSGRTVCIDTMSSGYYASHYVGAGRVF